MFFDYKYGQYFTLWDKTEGSFEGKGPHSYVKNMTEKECNNLAENDCKSKKVCNGEFTKNISQLLTILNKKIIYTVKIHSK
ncbi:mCG1036493 [Mus musculus]|jgi:lathosterol oxidase|nr:mCG1036493 [Mus musculus]